MLHLLIYSTVCKHCSHILYSAQYTTVLVVLYSTVCAQCTTTVLVVLKFMFVVPHEKWSVPLALQKGVRHAYDVMYI